MNTAVLVLSLANLALIGALPRFFFRPGVLNLRWWVTAAPFFVSAAALCTGLAGALTPLGAAPLGGTVAVLASATSVLLIGLTLGTHREPLSLWHQPDDTPRVIVTEGVYNRMRHPFYTAFLLALLGTVAAFPHWITALCFGFGLLQLNRTAATEERRLIRSEFGEDYALYRRRAGRFIPRIGRQPLFAERGGAVRGSARGYVQSPGVVAPPLSSADRRASP